MEQSIWAIELLMAENPPGCLWLEDADRIDRGLLDVDLALGELSRRVSRAAVDIRLTAVRALAWLADRRAITALIRGLGDTEWGVRLLAADALGEFAPLPLWALEPLIELLKDEELAVRMSAVKALRALPADASATAMTAVLNDPSRAVRSAAAWGLEELGCDGFFDSAAFGPLEHLLLQDKDPFVARAAYWALGWIPRRSEAREKFWSTPRGQWAWRIFMNGYPR